MFIQIIQGLVRDLPAARAVIDRWERDLEPGARGWLGGTYGFADDGSLVAVIRFESEQAARRNAARPEQQEWWHEMERLFVGQVVFHDCPDVTLLLGGGPDEAGFVQVIQGRVTDVTRMHTLVRRSADLIARHRPDILGATIAIDENGHFTETVAFSSEAAAREAEHQPMPPEAREVLDEEMSLIEDVEFVDLHQPWFAARH